MSTFSGFILDNRETEDGAATIRLNDCTLVFLKNGLVHANKKESHIFQLQYNLNIIDIVEVIPSVSEFLP